MALRTSHLLRSLDVQSLVAVWRFCVFSYICGIMFFGLEGGLDTNLSAEGYEAVKHLGLRDG